MKRIFLILLALIVFSGCTSSEEIIKKFEENENVRNWQEKNDSDYIVNKYGQAVIDAFIAKDSASFRNLLNSKIVNQSSTDKKIQSVFDFISGEITEYGEFERMETGGGGGYTFVSLCVPDIVTNCGKYSISVRICMDDKDEDMIGIEHITVFKNDPNDLSKSIDSIEIGVDS